MTQLKKGKELNDHVLKLCDEIKTIKKRETFVIGDVHGCYEQLVKCIFDASPSTGDRLIFLGDLVDRGNKSFEVVDYIIKLKERYEVIYLNSNHDDAFINGLLGEGYMLYNQGCMETLKSYIDRCGSDKYLNDNCPFRLKDTPASHQDFFLNRLPYFIDEENNCFVHGGFNRHKLIEDQDHNDLIWDRDLLHAARSFNSMKNNEYKFKMKNNFNEVFIGHTPVQYLSDEVKPVNYSNIWDIDCGAGKYSSGKVCIMNIKNKEYWLN